MDLFYENEAKKYFVLNLQRLNRYGFSNSGPQAQAGNAATRIEGNEPPCVELD